MNNLGYVEDLVSKHFPEEIVQVSDLTGTQDHIHILVVSEKFKGLMLIDQHQIIMDILKDDLKINNIHAVKIKTMTPEKYKQVLSKEKS